MKTLPKTLLIISIASFVISFTGQGADFASGVLKPLGAVCFIVFFITNLLATEMEEYDKGHNPESASLKKSQFHDQRPSGTPRRASSLVGAGAK